VPPEQVTIADVRPRLLRDHRNLFVRSRQLDRPYLCEQLRQRLLVVAGPLEIWEVLEERQQRLGVVAPETLVRLSTSTIRRA